MSDARFPGDTTSTTSTSSYPFNEEHTKEWNVVKEMSSDTPIARSWARLYDKGVYVGSPVGEPYESIDGKERQPFQYAFATFDPNEESNPNKIVVYTDARGAVGSESGL